MSTIDDAIFDAINRFNIECEKLTTEQLASALKQAIEAGDFIRYVRKIGPLSEAQQVAYQPLQRAQELEAKLAVAVEALTAIADIESAMRSSNRTASYGDWELRQLAREALAKIEGDGE